VPSATTAIITNVVVTNTATSAATFTLKLDGTDLATATAIAASSIATFDIKQVLDAADLLEGSASATTVNFHISGVEVA